jgi:GNAT superfamily N-acetyltransferase
VILRAVPPEEFAGPLVRDVVDVFAEALELSRHNARVQAMPSIIRRHSTYPGFRARGAFADDDRLEGFTYGFSTFAGGWWREQVAAALTPEQRRSWLADTFEFAELHVRPSAQGLGVGGRLHDELLREVPHRMALLSVRHGGERARRLYLDRGWLTLIEEMRFPGSESTPYHVMGRYLTADRSGTSPAR